MEALKRYKKVFEEYLATHPFSGQPNELYEPVQYIMNLGGKRLRPGITLMGYELYRSDIDRVMPVAMAVEVFHNFSLVHDDIMDEALVRRGKPSVHAKYGENTAILSGDVMLVLAYELLMQTDQSTHLAALMKVFTRSSKEVCEGQQMDMNFETQEKVSIPEYIKMIEFKTAALIASSLQMGAIVAGASEEDLYLLNEFGRHIGIAFQLQDDILDTFGDPKTFGKRIGGDIVQNKKTFLILKALEVASSEERARLASLMSSKPEEEEAKIKEVTQLLKDLNIPELAANEKEHYKDLAFKALDQLSVDTSKTQSLKDLSELIVGRKV